MRTGRFDEPELLYANQAVGRLAQFPQALQVWDTPLSSAHRATFVTNAPNSNWCTVLVPAPGFPGHHFVMLTSPQVEELIGLPVLPHHSLVSHRQLRHGDVLSAIPVQATSAEPDSSRFEEEESGLLQISSVPHGRSAVEGGSVSNLPASPRPDTVSASSAPVEGGSLSTLPGPARPPQTACFRPTDVGGIPTPFGLRRLSPSPTVLSLDKALPSASRPEEGPRLCTGVSAEMFDFIFKPFAWDLLCRDWTCVPDLSPTAASCLRPFTPARQPSAMQLYVDGSFGLNSTGQVRSGWSLCILCQVDSEWLWAGFLAVTCGAGGDSTLQAPVRSAFETELAALVHALAWCGGLF